MYSLLSLLSPVIILLGSAVSLIAAIKLGMYFSENGTTIGGRAIPAICTIVAGGFVVAAGVYFQSL